MSFNNRGDALIELLGEFDESEVRYVLVGGYAVSAFNTRFSTDLDIVVAPENRRLSRAFSKSVASKRPTAMQRTGFTIRKSSSTRNGSHRESRSGSIS